ncbi:MAG: signal peptidase II [Gemmatimonadaceae bacterium]
MPQRPRLLFVTLALSVAAVDLASKELAVALLSHRTIAVGHGVLLHVVRNDRSAFSISLGASTWLLNVVATLVALVLAAMICRPLAAVYRGAPVMLGLIAGAALGNLTSMLTSAAGVVDFIAVSYGPAALLVLNLADVAAYVGLAFSARAVAAILGSIRAERRARVVRTRRPVLERIVPIAVVAEPALAADARPRAERGVRQREISMIPVADSVAPRPEMSRRV